MLFTFRSKQSILLSCSLLTLSSLVFVSSAYSGGFALIENSASGMGKAFAGAAAAAEDASTVWFNPAGMTYLNENHLKGKSQLTNAGHVVVVRSKYKDKGSAPGAMDGNKNVADTLVSVVPNLYYVHPVNERITLGLAVNGPFGSKTEYEKDWIGRYHATLTDMMTVNVNPSISWKASDKLSLGAGVSAQYIKVKLGKSVDTGAACFKITGAFCLPPSTVANDSQVQVKGDDISFGFNLGLLYQPTKLTRLGVSYRSKIKHNLKGTIKYDLQAPLTALAPFVPALNNRAIKANVELPDMLSFSLAHKVNEKLELLGDVTWTQWSTFDELRINEADGVTHVSATQEDWEDVTRVSVGANYKYSDRLVLRTGLAYDEEPIPSALHRTPRIPGHDRTWVSLGAGYKLNKKMSLDFGYSHLFIKDALVNHTEENGVYTVKGEYNSHVDIFSAQLNYTF